ncbi:hypothetical protein QOT17_019373 [Balamuthia mandrillaris]
MEAGLAVDYVMASELLKLKELFIGVDESSKVDGRSFVEVEFGGFCEEPVSTTTQQAKTAVEPVATEVSWPVVVKKVLSHTAQQLCDLIEECLLDTQAKQRTQGIISGLGVLLQKKRVEAWQKEHGAGSYPPTELEIKGCDDHIASLISQHFLEKMEQQLTLWTKCSGLSVCNSQTVINNGNDVLMVPCSSCQCCLPNHMNSVMLSKRLRMFPWKSSFQGLDPHISIPWVMETRYVSFEQMAGVVLEHHDALLEFFKLHSQDTDAETAKLLFQVLSNPLVTRVLHVMTWGLRWLKQLMAVGNQVKKRETYVAHLQAFFQDIVRFKQSPKQLATNLNVPWSLIEPYKSSNSKTKGMGSRGMPQDNRCFNLAQDWCDCAHMLLSKYNQSLLSLEEKEALEGEEDITAAVAITVTTTASKIYPWNQLLR